MPTCNNSRLLYTTAISTTTVLLILMQSLPLRPHSPADLESVAMTELQEKQEKKKKNMNHPIIIFYSSNP